MSGLKSKKEMKVEISVSEFEEFKFGLETLRLRERMSHLDEEVIADFNAKTNTIEECYKEMRSYYGFMVQLERKIEILKFERLKYGRLSVVRDEL